MKKGLIIVDLLDGFVNEGPLADKSINKIVLENVRLAESFINDNHPVIFVKDCHNEDSTEFLFTSDKHCIKGTNEANLIKELRIFEDKAIVVEKNAINAFCSLDFQKHLPLLESLDEIVITGCETDMCVLSLAITLRSYFDENNIKKSIIVPTNAVATYHVDGIHDGEFMQNTALKFMKNLGIQITDKY